MANMASACALVIANDSKMFGTMHSWRTREAASTCVLVTISAVCICIMVVCGVMLAREYSLAKGYDRTSCTVRNVTYTGSEQSCVFCSGHKEKGKDKASSSCVTSYFPCVQVIVTYVNDWVVFEALVHHDSLQASGLHRECSFNICLKEKENNRIQVDKYADEWRLRLGQTIDCFYNTADSSDVIMQKMYTLSDVVHSMFWPSLVIVICGVVFLRLETRRRRLTFCGRQDDLDDDAIESSPSRKSTPDTIDGLETRVILRDDRLLQYGGVQCKLVHPRHSLSAERTNWHHSHSSMINVSAATSAGGAGGGAGAGGGTGTGAGQLNVYDDITRIEMKRRSLDASSCHQMSSGLRFAVVPFSVLPPSQTTQQRPTTTMTDCDLMKLRGDMTPRKSLPITIRLTPELKDSRSESASVELL